MKTLTVYSRRGCHLCENLIEELLPMIEGTLRLDVREIDTNAAWLERWAGDIPVVEYDGEVVCTHFLDREAITGILRG
ncbi:MAG: glutaredoxin family protein [Woeseiaceae bacterium]|nr:glutaredoxin family protein [Woeseiaceae bacterium]